MCRGTWLSGNMRAEMCSALVSPPRVVWLGGGGSAHLTARGHWCGLRERMEPRRGHGLGCYLRDSDRQRRMAAGARKDAPLPRQRGSSRPRARLHRPSVHLDSRARQIVERVGQVEAVEGPTPVPHLLYTSGRIVIIKLAVASVGEVSPLWKRGLEPSQLHVECTLIGGRLVERLEALRHTLWGFPRLCSVQPRVRRHGDSARAWTVVGRK